MRYYLVSKVLLQHGHTSNNTSIYTFSDLKDKLNIIDDVTDVASEPNTSRGCEVHKTSVVRGPTEARCKYELCKLNGEKHTLLYEL